MKSLCIDDCSDLLSEYLPEGTHFLSTFPGPFWLASLLEIVSHHLFRHALIHIPIPNIFDVNEWNKEVVRLAHARPYLWPNHKRIIEEQHCLDRGISTVLSLPTGAGKTTIAQLKTAAILADKHKVLFLAPTHALVKQVTNDWQACFPDVQVKNSFLFDGEYAEIESETLPDITVMTPERCLALLMIAPQAFGQVGLVIMDECHILYASSLQDSYRSIDAMLCLLRLFSDAENADFLLMSAMIENSVEIAAWIGQQTGRKCVSAYDEWKPTRQVKSCVIYSHGEISGLKQRLSQDRREAIREKRKNPGAAVKRDLSIQPFGFFSLNQTWNTTQLRDYIVLPISNERVFLSANNFWNLTSNRNAVSASLAATLSDANLKTIVFSQQIIHTVAISQQVANTAHVQNKLEFNYNELDLWDRLTEELGSSDRIYGPVQGLSACHHGLLLAEERELVEGLFKRNGGIKVLAATPTLAQGMNLPAEAVIIAGDERYDTTLNKQEQLEAHELLNAAGRAGRAGMSALGFVLIVPGAVVEFNEETNSLAHRWFTLQEHVFSKSDQCLTIIDPLQRLIDSVQAGYKEETRPVQYILQRIALDPAQTTEENVRLTMSRSFAAFMAKQQNKIEEFENGVNATAILGREIISATQIEKYPWLMPLATELGMDPEVLLSINDLLGGIIPNWGVKDYINWLFENHLIDRMFKPKTQDDIVDTLSTKKEREENRNITELTFNRLKPLILRWIAGSPFNEMEVLAGTHPAKIKKCNKARKVALRWSAEVAYALGVITRLYRRRCDAEPGIIMPISLGTVAACLRQGVDSPEKLAIFHILDFEISRVRAHRIFDEIHEHLDEGDLYEKFYETLGRVRVAMDRTYL